LLGLEVPTSLLSRADEVIEFTDQTSRISSVAPPNSWTRFCAAPRPAISRSSSRQTRYHALLSRFKARTGCGVLVNTSFNVRGEPIVCTPEDAFRCFMGSDIEMLAVENCLLHKEEQDPSLKLDYKNAFELD
jgi:hypothetical protein